MNWNDVDGGNDKSARGIILEGNKNHGLKSYQSGELKLRKEPKT